VEELLDYNLGITLVPPVAIRKALRHIPHWDILHSDVHVVSVYIGRIEFNEPFVLSACEKSLDVGKKNETNAGYEMVRVREILTLDNASKFVISA